MRTSPAIAVLGAGAWGQALACVAARAGRPTVLWSRTPKATPASPLITATTDLSEAARAPIVLAVVPAQALRGVMEALALVARPGTAVVVAAKGIERGSGRFMTEVVAEAAPALVPAILSGPSFSADVIAGLPTAVTAAAADAGLARVIAATLSSGTFRVYHSTDVRGVEIGGAAKNVLAIAAGIVAGRGLGASAGAALVARGFAELSRFAQAHGGRAETLMGLSGLGDLILTCSGPQSRNFAYGLALASGQAKSAGGPLAEGALTADILVEMAEARGLDMPIARSVRDVVAGRLGVDTAIGALLARPLKGEQEAG